MMKLVFYPLLFICHVNRIPSPALKVRGRILFPLQQADVSHHYALLLKVAEILIGLVMLCLGVTISPFPHDYEGRHSTATKTGYHLWGSLSFFISGVVSIIAGRKVTKCLIQASLGMNALSATVAGIGTSMIITEEISMYESAMWSSPYETVFTGLLMGMLLLSLGGGCTALALAISACRAACSVSKVVVFLPNDDGSPSEVSPEHVYDEVTF